MSMRQPTVVGDGSSVADRRETVEIDLRDDRDRFRYRCPNGHTSWTRTNSHIWCKACADAAQHGADVTPEHYEIHDQKTERDIPWSAVNLVEK